MPRRQPPTPEQVLARRLLPNQVELISTLHSLGGRCRRQFLAEFGDRVTKKTLVRLGIIKRTGTHVTLTTFGLRVLRAARPGLFLSEEFGCDVLPQVINP